MATGRRYSETEPSQRRPSRADYEHELQCLNFDLDKAQRRSKVYGFFAAALFIYAFVLPHWTRPVVPPTRLNNLQRGTSLPTRRYDGSPIPWIPAQFDSAHNTLDAPLDDLSAAQLGWIFRRPNEVLNYQWEHHQHLYNQVRSASGESDFLVLREAELRKYVDEYLKKPYALDGELCKESNGTLHASICAVARQRFDDAFAETINKGKGWFWQKRS